MLPKIQRERAQAQAICVGVWIGTSIQHDPDDDRHVEGETLGLGRVLKLIDVTNVTDITCVAKELFSVGLTLS